MPSILPLPLGRHAGQHALSGILGNPLSTSRRNRSGLFSELAATTGPATGAPVHRCAGRRCHLSSDAVRLCDRSVGLGLGDQSEGQSNRPYWPRPSASPRVPPLASGLPVTTIF